MAIFCMQRFTDMLDNDDLDAVIYPVQDNPPPFIGDWNASFGAYMSRSVCIFKREPA